MKKRIAGCLLAVTMILSAFSGVSATTENEVPYDLEQEADIQETDEVDFVDDTEFAGEQSKDEAKENVSEENDGAEASDNTDSLNDSDESDGSEEDALSEEEVEEFEAGEPEETADSEDMEEEEAVTYASVSSKVPVNKVAADYRMRDEYAFTYAFRSGITSLSYISRSNGTLNSKMHDWFGDKSGFTADYCKTFYACAIDSTTYTDPITAIYSNVGEYQGKIVDLRVTATEWGPVNNDHIGLDGKKIIPCVLFYRDRIAFNTVSVGTVRFRFEFLDHNSQTQIYPKGHVTAADLDGGQSIRIYDGWGVDAVYIRSGHDYLSVTTGASANGTPFNEIKGDKESITNGDVRGWCQLDFNGYFMLNWNAQEKWKTTTKPQNAFYISTGKTVGTYEPNPVPEKRVGDDGASFAAMAKHEFNAADPAYEITPGRNFDYIIAQRILPGTYSSFEVSDTLDSCLTLRSASVTTAMGMDVTGKFNITTSGNTVTFAAKSWFLNTDEAYNDVTYYFRIQVTAGNNQTIEAHGHYNADASYFAIPNGAGRTLVSDRMSDTKTTNLSWVKGNFQGQYCVKKVNAEDPAQMLTGAEFELYEWNRGSGQYVPTGRKLEYRAGTGMYHTGLLYRSNSNEGRFKIVETGVPAGFEGGWQTEVNIMQDGPAEKMLVAPNQEIIADCELTVTKKIREQEITWAHGNPVFRFRVTGTDQKGISHVYEDYVEFRQGEYTVEGEYAVLSCVFRNVPRGKYTVRELQTLRYLFESAAANTANVTVSGTDEIVLLDRNNKKAGITFVNKKTRYDRYSHTDVIRNTISLRK